MVESILIDVEARYELIYRIADSIGLVEPTVPVSLRNLQSPAQFTLPSGSVCEKVFKRSFANRSNGIQRFIMRPLLYTVFKQIMIMRPKVIVKISLN